MSEQKFLDDDIVRVYRFGLPHRAENLISTLFWGDRVQVVGKIGDEWKLDFSRRVWNPDTHKYEWVHLDAGLPGKVRFREQPLLKVRFLDVGQGDSCIIESPQGKLILVDGGEGEQLRNYMTAAWAHVFRYQPLDIAAIVVTHGDADHFAGLTDLLEATRGYDRPLVNVKRVYHNGLVKGPSSSRQTEIFGNTEEINDQLYITDLVDDLRPEPDSRMNRPFRQWKKALNKASIDNPDFEMKRVAYGDQTAFDFLDAEGVKLQVVGPITEQVNGLPALPFLHSDRAHSASHTINGHSVVLKLTYGNLRLFFGGDMNAEAEAGLLKQARLDNLSLASEVLKVPHHGSDDFDPRLLEAVRPVVSIVSSGDERKLSEYIHPRANLVGSLSKYSRATVEKPLVYITETVAFFERVGLAHIYPLDDSNQEGEPISTTNAYIKKTFGIVHVRADRNRLLVASHSGKPDQKESYAFTVDSEGQVSFDKVRSVN